MEGAEDWVMATDVAWVAKSTGGAAGEDLIRTLSVRLIRRVLEDGMMEIGDVTDGGFFEWNLPIDEAAELVDRKWRELGRSPNLGDVCWLENTQKGNRRAEALFERRARDSLSQ